MALSTGTYSSSGRQACLTFVERDGRAGLMLWSPGGERLPRRLQACFARGRLVSDVELYLPEDAGGLGVAEVEGWWIEAAPVAEELATIPLGEIRRFSDAAAIWILASKWVVEALARQQIVPSLRATADPNRWRAGWRVAPVRSEDRSRLAGLAAAMPGAARCQPSGEHAVLTAATALQRFLDAAVDGLMRAESAETMPIPGSGPDWVKRLAASLGGPERIFEVRGVHDLHLRDTLERWIAPATTLGEGGRPVVGFRLAEPHTDGASWTLSFHLYAAAGGERVAAADLEDPPAGVRAAVSRMVSPQDTLVEALGRCARVFAPLGRALTERLPSHVSVDATEAWDFLTSASLKLKRAGYFVEVPAALSRVGRRRVRARMRLGVDAEHAEGSTGTGLLSGIVGFRWEACLGDDRLTPDEFRELTRTQAPLVYHRGQWIAVDPADVARLRALLGEGEGALDAAEALRLALGGEVEVPEGDGVRAEVVGEGEFADAVVALRAGTAAVTQDLAPPAGLDAELRPYQQRGYAWLASVTGMGFGACLADDMGLGKTIQLLAMAAMLGERGLGRRFMVVCPTSVIGNWRREAKRFVPSIRSVIHHGPSRAQDLRALRRVLRGAPEERGRPVLLITSYALARRDRELLASETFDVLVLDEAQNIKNPEAAQSKAVRYLQARRRVAMTGTPVENRLSELWSIIDFLNPGLLGGRTSFKKTFAVPIERYGDEDAAAALRKVTGPFILRRTKADPAIAPELPDKVETTRFCPLTREQAALYQATIDSAFEELEELDVGIRRRGRILAMITALKQICNHPAHYLHDGDLSPRRSGKLTRFLELIDGVVAADGHALIFTQYRAMGEILCEVMGERVGERIPFLHGGLSRNQREHLVNDFQSPRGPMAMVVSLRAGGTGLNLTRANHVFHYDRWWNPAVEDQATDRAFRIGQTRDVTVHRLVSQGTMEEQIDQLLTDKRALADKVVGSGEVWLSELDDASLRSLVTLGQDAVLEEAW